MPDSDSSDDIVCLGYVKPETVLPHTRNHCAEFPYKPNQATNDENKRYCEKCFCYVCDIEASKCLTWTNDQASILNDTGRGFDHCMAFDKGLGYEVWKARRNIKSSTKFAQHVHNKFSCAFNQNSQTMANRKSNIVNFNKISTEILVEIRLAYMAGL